MCYNYGVRGARPPTALPTMNNDQPIADILAIGQGFGATEVELKALTGKGREGLRAIGGGFACIGLTVRKSSLGDYLDNLRKEGCVVSWAS